MQRVVDYAEYLELINNSKCVVKFTAKWCGPCKKLSPFFNKLVEEYSDSGINFLEIDIDKAEKITNHENIQGVPTILFYHHGGSCKDLNVVGFNQSLTHDNIKLFSELSSDQD